MEKIVFISHNFFGAACLTEILKILERNRRLGEVVLIITRKYRPEISDYSREFQEISERCKIDLIETDNINDRDVKDSIKKRNPDFIFVIGWSQIIDKEILEIPKKDIFGTHPSILPKNRGGAVIPWQILNNETKSGVTLFRLEESLDSGDIVAQEIFDIDEDEKALTFYNKIIEAGKKLIEKNLLNILKGDYGFTPQNNKLATLLGARKPEDGLIDWRKDSATIDRLIRAVGKPYPGAYSYYNFKKVIILEAEPFKEDKYQGVPGSILASENDGIIVQTGNGLIKIKKIYVENLGEMDAREYLKPWSKFGFNVEDEIVKLKKEIESLKNALQAKRA